MGSFGGAHHILFSKKSTPMVFLYSAVKIPLQYFWIIEDFPTAPFPTITTFKDNSCQRIVKDCFYTDGKVLLCCNIPSKNISANPQKHFFCGRHLIISFNLYPYPGQSDTSSGSQSKRVLQPAHLAITPFCKRLPSHWSRAGML